MRIGSNNSIISRLNESSRTLSRALERLSSGNRLIRFADDPASASAVVRLTASLRGRRAENLALNQTQGLVQITKSALELQTEILQKMRELTIQASNETLTSANRKQISDQVVSLSIELDRIAKDANFNGINLIDQRSEVFS